MNTIAKKFADIASRTTRPNPNAIGPAATNDKVEYFSSKSKHDTNIAMTTQSDTPRTDAQHKWVKMDKSTMAFARALERELNAANERNAELEQWKSSALAVEREWNPNELATMLGGKLGESQRVVIMREVPKLLERIKQLEAALESTNSEIEEMERTIQSLS